MVLFDCLIALFSYSIWYSFATFFIFFAFPLSLMYAAAGFLHTFATLLLWWWWWWRHKRAQMYFHSFAIPCHALLDLFQFGTLFLLFSLLISSFIHSLRYSYALIQSFFPIRSKVDLLQAIYGLVWFGRLVYFDKTWHIFLI